MGCARLTLSELLKQRYPDISRKELFARILCGEVAVNGDTIREPKTPVKRDCEINFKLDKKFVSRGGEKLSYVLQAWQVRVEDLVFIDAGSSAGGFADCLLRNGASKVFAVDVGYNQLDYRLRRDKRVVVLERINIMSIRREMLEPPPDAAVADLSFRSIRKAASHILSLVSRGWLIALIKPQFEWIKPDLSFRGVVSDRESLAWILKSLVEELEQENVFVSKMAASPTRGRKGNLEFFFLLTGERQKSLPAISQLLDGLIYEGVP